MCICVPVFIYDGHMYVYSYVCGGCVYVYSISGCKYMSALWHVYACVYAYVQRSICGTYVCMCVFVCACHILTPGHTHMWRTKKTLGVFL